MKIEKLKDGQIIVEQPLAVSKENIQDALKDIQYLPLKQLLE